jgi:hypothetical protein
MPGSRIRPAEHGTGSLGNVMASTHVRLLREERIYFKVIHSTPSGQHRLARPVAAGGTLRADHLAVAVVHCQQGPAGQPRFEVSGPTGQLLRERVAIMSYLHSDPGKLRTLLLSHEDDRKLTCSLKGFEGVRGRRCGCAHCFLGIGRGPRAAPPMGKTAKSFCSGFPTISRASRSPSRTKF